MKKMYYYYKGKVTALKPERSAERDENGFYNVKDVISWFLSIDSMSPKKLQKLLYYAYAWTLTIQNEEVSSLNIKLFDEKFEAWVHGPVIPNVYHEFKEHGYSDIPQTDDIIHFDKDVEDILNQVWEAYGEFTGNQLESITHQEKPWINARGDCSPLERCKNDILDSDVFEYYIQEVEYDD